MSPEEQNTRIITIKRSPARRAIENQKHNKIDKTLAVIVAAAGLVWTIYTGVNYFLDQRKAMPPYQDDLRMIEQPYNLTNLNGPNIPETRGYLLLLL